MRHYVKCPLPVLLVGQPRLNPCRLDSVIQGQRECLREWHGEGWSCILNPRPKMEMWLEQKGWKLWSWVSQLPWSTEYAPRHPVMYNPVILWDRYGYSWKLKWVRHFPVKCTFQMRLDKCYTSTNRDYHRRETFGQPPRWSLCNSVLPFVVA